MNSDYGEFSQKFQLRLLALLARHPKEALHVIKADYFSLPMHADIAKVIHNVFRREDPKKPRLTAGTLRELVRLDLKKSRKHSYSDNKKDYLGTVRKLYKMKLSDREIVLKQAQSFAQDVRYRDALVQAEKYINLRDYGPVLKLFSDLRSTENVSQAAQSLPIYPLYSFIRREDSQNDTSDYLVYPIIPKQGAILLFGLPKELKSWMAAALALDAASGRKALAFFEVPEPISVLYVQVEDPTSVTRNRLTELDKKQGPRRTMGQVMLKVVPRCNINLSDPSSLAGLTKMIEKCKFKLVVFDVLRRLFRGNVADSKDTADFLAILDTFRDRYGCAVLLVHHSRKNDTAEIQSRALGSINLTAWADVLLYVSGKQATAQSSFSKLEIESKQTASDENELMLNVDGSKCPMVRVMDRFQFELDPVIKALRKCPGLNQKELQLKLNYPDKKLRALLKRAVERGFVVARRGKGKTLRYYPKVKKAKAA